MIPSALGRLGGVRTVNITSNQTNYNLRTALGSPAGAMRIVVNIGSGVTISSSNNATPAFDEGSGWTIGTLITINNAGVIWGAGGGGGDGGAAACSNSGGYPVSATKTAGANGNAGGPALKLTVPTWINNATGNIFGGGGGGGGGGGAWGYIYWEDGQQTVTFGGGGGGGGRGPNNSGSGTGGNATNNVIAYDGANGTAGSSSSAGTYGAGGIVPEYGSWQAPRGGAGGDWGTAGSSGANVGLIGDWAEGSIAANGSGGAAGKAVDLNGQTLTWISGNDPSRVKGAVS